MKASVRVGVVAILLLGVGAAGLFAQDGAIGPFAPRIPSYRRPLDLFVRERLVVVEEGRPLRVVRYGKAGDLEEPGVLDLPFEGRSLEVFAYDWIAAGDRSVEVRRIEGFAQWIELGPSSHLLLVDENRADLVYGMVTFFGDPTYASVLRIGAVTIDGSGRADLRRGANAVAITVETGRFEVSRDGTLLASLGAGQTRRIELTGLDALPPDAASAAPRLDAVSDAIVEALFLEWSPGALDLDAGALTPIWESASAALPVYARALYENERWIRYPDIWERRIGEALRIVAAYSFAP